MEININDKGNIPLAKLSELVGKRAGELQQSTKDCAIASMIQVLVSIRKQTLKAKISAKTNPKIELQSHLHASVTKIDTGEKTIKALCVRDAANHKLESTKELPIRIAEKKIHAKFLHVFLVTPEFRPDKKYLILAKSATVAKNYEALRVKKWIKAHRGFAKYVLSLLSHDLSSKSSIEQLESEKLKALKEKVRESKVEEKDKSARVSVEDKLNYAISAVKGGQTEIDNSIKKACNKVAGLLAQAYKKHGLSRTWETPFPEVKQRKK